MYLRPDRPRRITRELARLAELAERGALPAGAYAEAQRLVLAGATAVVASERAEGLTSTG